MIITPATEESLHRTWWDSTCNCIVEIHEYLPSEGCWFGVDFILFPYSLSTSRLRDGVALPR